jgi:DNA-directed RNA polymerase specialized sigma24 family protein
VYLKPRELRQFVIESQESGTISPGLYDAIVKLVGGIRGRWGMAEPDDTLQDVFLAVLRHLDKIDPKKNVFSYLTTLVRNEVFKRHRDAEKYMRLLGRLGEGLK